MVAVRCQLIQRSSEALAGLGIQNSLQMASNCCCYLRGAPLLEHLPKTSLRGLSFSQQGGWALSKHIPSTSIPKYQEVEAARPIKGYLQNWWSHLCVHLAQSIQKAGLDSRGCGEKPMSLCGRGKITLQMSLGDRRCYRGHLWKI